MDILIKLECIEKDNYLKFKVVEVNNADLIDVEVRKKYIQGDNHFNDPCEMTANPVRWWHAAGTLGSEFAWYPEGNLGPSTKADGKKAIEGVEAVLDYMESLVNDIVKSVPRSRCSFSCAPSRLSRIWSSAMPPSRPWNRAPIGAMSV